jgi:hypothetical protein
VSATPEEVFPSLFIAKASGKLRRNSASTLFLFHLHVTNGFFLYVVAVTSFVFPGLGLMSFMAQTVT